MSAKPKSPLKAGALVALRLLLLLCSLVLSETYSDTKWDKKTLSIFFWGGRLLYPSKSPLIMQ